ncbi:LysE family transporter [Sediminibacterium sp.]|uniref:LysE family transporter n=1 Tax=Sediminibacterium sp. TaxID=1917865 RepID=UPI0025E0A751|nr:LysE family transporter [Sediminibacterium sp.]
MKQLTKLILSAFTISFLGSLPLGSLNITITNISLQIGYYSALNFAIGAILVEVIMVKLSYTAIVQLEKFKPLLKKLNRVSIVVLVTLSIFFITSAFKETSTNSTDPIKLEYPILWGALLSFLNPLHLPFWMAWSSILKSKGLLTSQILNQIIYLFAIALGTGLAFCLYAILGTELTTFLQNKAYLVNGMIGFTFLVIALIQLVKQLKK